jgi:hypothetical protein
MDATELLPSFTTFVMDGVASLEQDDLTGLLDRLHQHCSFNEVDHNPKAPLERYLLDLDGTFKTFGKRR